MFSRPSCRSIDRHPGLPVIDLSGNNREKGGGRDAVLATHNGQVGKVGMDEVGAPGDLKRDPETGRDHLSISLAGLWAAERCVRPLDRLNKNDLNALLRDAKPGGQGSPGKALWIRCRDRRGTGDGRTNLRRWRLRVRRGRRVRRHHRRRNSVDGTGRRQRGQQEHGGHGKAVGGHFTRRTAADGDWFPRIGYCGPARQGRGGLLASGA